MKFLLAISLCTLLTLVTCPYNPLRRRKPLTSTPCTLSCSPGTHPDPKCENCIPSFFSLGPLTNTEPKKLLNVDTCPVRFCPHGWVWSVPCGRCVPNNLAINNQNRGYPPVPPRKCNGPICPPGWIWSTKCGKCVANQFQPIEPIPEIAEPPTLFCQLKCLTGFIPNPNCTFCVANTLVPSFP